jgi:SAM-dependent methyltransferase
LELKELNLNFRNAQDILVVVANYDFSANADLLKSEFIKYFPTLIIDSSSPIPPNEVDILILNEFYTGLWNESVKHASQNGYKWLFFIASDVEVKDIPSLVKYIRLATRNNEIGVYSPSLDISSRSSFPMSLNRHTSGLREIGIVEGFCFLARLDLLTQVYPVPSENVYGWGVDILVCKVAYDSNLKVVCDDRIQIFHPAKKSIHSIDSEAAAEMSNQMLGEQTLSWVSEIQLLLGVNQNTFGDKTALDLGCGAYIQNEFNAEKVFGVDIERHEDPRILKRNLALKPIPFRKNTFDYVTAYDFIEHIPRSITRFQNRYCFVELMNEIWRVLKDGGLFLSLTPAFPSPKAFQDPTHVNFITEETFSEYFCRPNLWGEMYGFRGRFDLVMQVWEDGKLRTLIRAIK